MSRSTITGLLGAVAFALASDVAAQPSMNINDYVLFASRMIKTKGPTIYDGTSA